MFIPYFIVTAVLELLAYAKPVWAYRIPLNIAIFILNSVGVCLGLLHHGFNVFGLLLTCAYIFRLFNTARVIKQRMHSDYIRSVCLRTSFTLVILTSILLTISHAGIVTLDLGILHVFTWAQAIVALLLIISTITSLVKSGDNNVSNNFSDQELPTVTVGVPARNETEDLELCINSLLASTYPKLEILVLDDCSTDSTSDIIKKFAHAGVRFIKGSTPDEHWLPKNHAYQRLAEEASGQYLIFCGVDTRITSQTITKLMSLVLTKNLNMVSVLPRRLTNNSLSAIIQPMRYWWELTLPRWLMNSPPVLSTFWIVNRSDFLKSGGFSAVSRSILPERWFAKLFAERSSYSFIRSNEFIDVQTTKPIQDQRDTALRVRYPQVHRRPEWVMLITLFEVCFLLLPLVLLTCSIFSDSFSDLLVPSLVATLLVVANHVLIVFVTNPANVPIALINYPFVILVEIYIGYESMLRYEFGTVDWKDRNICIPVMHTVPHLPPS